MSPFPLSALTAQMLSEGYRPEPPPALAQAAKKIDAELCASLTCESCGHLGLNYHPFHRGRSYRALASCPNCGLVEEI